MKKIESIHNPFVKHLIQLQSKSKTRKQTQTFLIEGLREISLALKGGYSIDSILFCAEILSIHQIKSIVTGNTEFIEISSEVYKKLAYRDTTEGVLAVAQTKSLELNALKLSDNPLILVAEGIEKPGNIGALLRTADAASVDAVLIANPKSDLYNPNVVRASVGCVFTTNIGVGTTPEIAAYLKEHKVNIYCATLQEAVSYHTLDYTQPSALVVGTEATGVTDEFRALADKNIIIPMQGEIDSMNVSVAASILIFEAKRQRGFAASVTK